MQECSSITQPISSRDLLHTIMCPRRDKQEYYAKQCLDGTFNICGGQSLWSQCIHENEDHPFVNTIVVKKTSHGRFISYMMENKVEILNY